MKTTHDGLNFRSRTEASWYAFFNLMGMHPVYEPEYFELRYIQEPEVMGGDNLICNYLPDFLIDIGGKRLFVEIKSTASEEEGADIAKACILGYTHPTLICVGWPVECSVALINERYKGSPKGRWCRFGIRGNKYGLQLHDELCFCGSYPDELRLFLCKDELAEFSQHRHRDATGLARQAWNATQWRGVKA